MAAAFMKRFINSEQHRNDINTELNFLNLIVSVIAHSITQDFDDVAIGEIHRAFNVANTFGPATDAVTNEFRTIIDQTFEKSSNLKITFSEKVMILTTMGFFEGHWYKCKNNHYYAIGECGGAMEEATCPECEETIGGGSHKLAIGNAVATEMDGATKPSW